MLRNRDFRQFLLLFLSLSAAAVAAGFFIDPAAGILVAFFALCSGLAFFIFTKARYKGIAEISDQIDGVLHNADYLSIGESEEGELSILRSEIAKMTLRIREQNEALKKEKGHLADALADIAHQLRTPLTSLNLILSLLENNPEAAERKAFLREGEALLLHMDWLITALLKLSRLDAGIVVFQNEAVTVKTVVTAALRPLLIPMELHSITLEVTIPDGAVLQGDSQWLSEALQNILKNCMESAGEKGHIGIACASNPLFTELVFHDDGPGFKEEDLPCLFDRFYRGKNPSGEGYGIGLALSKMIITAQGGTLTAKNHPKGGAVFALRFPK